MPFSVIWQHYRMTHCPFYCITIFSAYLHLLQGTHCCFPSSNYALLFLLINALSLVFRLINKPVFSEFGHSWRGEESLWVQHANQSQISFKTLAKIYICGGNLSFEMHLLVLCNMSTYAVLTCMTYSWSRWAYQQSGAHIGPDSAHKSNCFLPLISPCSMKIEPWIMNERAKRKIV